VFNFVGSVAVFGETFINDGKGSFQPNGLARIIKNPKRPNATPRTTKITGDILPEFIY